MPLLFAYGKTGFDMTWLKCKYKRMKGKMSNVLNKKWDLSFMGIVILSKCANCHSSELKYGPQQTKVAPCFCLKLKGWFKVEV